MAMRTNRVVFGALALLGASVIGGDAWANPGSVFQHIKDKENLLGPLPPETSHLTVGSMDCDSGQFKMGAFPSTNAEVGGGGYNTIQHVTNYSVTAFAKHVHMRFDVTNRKGRAVSASLSFGTGAQNADGSLINPKHASGNDDFVSFEIGESTGRFWFAVKCGDKVTNGPALFNNGQPYTGYRDPAHCPKTNEFCNCPPSQPGCVRNQYVQYFDHSHYWADGGAFDVEAVPVAVIYEPPVDKEKKSFAEYINKAVIGSKTTFTYSSSHSNEHDVTPPMNDTNQAATEASLAGKGLIASGNPYAMAAGAVLEAVSTGLGSTSATETTGASHSTSNGLSTRFTASTTTQTGTQGDLRGPGDGDYVWYYHHAYFAWEAENSKPIHSVFLGADVLRSHQVWQLKADLAELAGKDGSAVGSKTALHKKSIESLLKLDPFAMGGVDAPLPAGRFVDATGQLEPGTDKICPTAPKTYKLKVDQAYTQGDTSASFTTDTTKYSKGFLAFLGWGVTEDKTLITNVGVSRSHDSYTVDTHVYEAHLFANSSDKYCTKVYFDKLFGTFAFKQVRGN